MRSQKYMVSENIGFTPKKFMVSKKKYAVSKIILFFRGEKVEKSMRLPKKICGVQ